MATVRFLYNKDLIPAVDAIEAQEPPGSFVSGRRLFEDSVEYDPDEEDDVERDADRDKEIAKFIADYLPFEDWWIFGWKKSAEATSDDDRPAFGWKVLEYYWYKPVKSKAGDAAVALAEKYGGAYTADGADEFDPEAGDEFPVVVGAQKRVEERALRGEDSLEIDASIATMERDAPMPRVDPTGDALFQHQSYLQNSPSGINVKGVWEHHGADGATVALGVVDEGWTRQHVEFQGKHIRRFGDINDEARGHGTGVLGVICARDNKNTSPPPTPGPAIGIVPGIKDIWMASPFVKKKGKHDPYRLRAKAIAWAACQLKKHAQTNGRCYGDVLLIEAQTRVKHLLVPVEIDLLSYAVIRAAWRAGIIVIEPGGNGHMSGEGHVDFDDLLVRRWCRTTGRKRQAFPLAPNRVGYRDSHAIIVGAVTMSAPHRRLPFSPIGNRIDVWAPGEQVVTCDSFPVTNRPATGAPEFSTDTYQAGFAGTSAAAAVIAGVVASIQGILDGRGKRRLWPEEMRVLLKERGSICFDDRTNFVVGRMPDMKKLVDLAIDMASSAADRRPKLTHGC